MISGKGVHMCKGSVCVCGGGVALLILPHFLVYPVNMK